MRIRTEAIHFNADKKLLTHIEEKMQKLEHFFDRIVDAKVILKLENTGQIKDKIVEIQLNVPRGRIFHKESAKTFENSLDAALKAITRQLKKYKDRRRAA